MLIEFLKNSQRFGLKTTREVIHSDEALVKFENKNQVRSFFVNAMRDPMNRASIHRIAKCVAPSYCCRSTKNKLQPSDDELLELLFSQIESGNASLVLKNDGLMTAHKQNAMEKENEKYQFEEFNFLELVLQQVNHLKNIYSKIVHADYPILEKVFQFDEHSEGSVPAIIDQASVKEHSTGWKAWEDPFEIGTLGMFKALATHNVSTFLKLSDSIMMVALAGSQTELTSAQYLVTAKSIIIKKWYGSYAVRYNLGTLSFEIPWVKYIGCGAEERMIVELKRKDRLMFHTKQIYNHPEVLIPPFISIEQFLSDYQNNFTPPEYDVTSPIQIS